jgi:hypothetical protein
VSYLVDRSVLYIAEYPYAPVDDGAYEAYPVDTDISDIMAYASESNRFGN